MTASPLLGNANNPLVSISTFSPGGGAASLPRYSYQKIDFSQRDFFVYAQGVSGGSGITPNSANASYFVPLGDVITQPSFETDDAWKMLQGAGSGIATPVSSIMPKLMIPTQQWTDNGVKDVPAYATGLFDWTTESVADLEGNFSKAGVKKGQFFVSSKYKNDNGLTEMTVNLQANDATTGMVGVGAFCLLLDVTQLVPGGVPPTEKQKWNVDFAFGEVAMSLADSGALTVAIGKTITKVQLTDAAAKEAPPQTSLLKKPYVICIAPTWNGLLISNGVQDVRSVVKVSSTYCAKTPGISISDPRYQTGGGFDPKYPQDIEISSDATTTVDLGTSITISASNCRFNLAYLPLFYSNTTVIENYFVGQNDKSGSEDVPASTYQYEVFNVWTSNSTGYTATSTIEDGPVIDENTTWKIVKTILSTSEGGGDTFPRNAGELFSIIVRTREDTPPQVSNGTGTYQLSATGSESSPRVGSWVDCIKNVSVNINLGGSSGTITVDKYALCGQGGSVTQSIGGLSIYVKGGYATTGGTIWSGLAYGAGMSESVSGAEITIPLKGMEQKLTDIPLILTPFLDGMGSGDVFDYLCRYGGVDYNIHGSNVILSSSTDIMAPRFDIKTGTSVMDGLKMVLADVGYAGVFQPDGVLNLYELGDDGLPTSLGRSVNVSNTQQISLDQTPDFEDMRNTLVMVGMQQYNAVGRTTDLTSLPIFPLVSVHKDYGTNPRIEWTKGMLYGMPGYTTQAGMESVAGTIMKLTRVYELTGTTTIPGDASIRLYNTYEGLVISGITHTIDLQSKTWTTSLEFSGSGDN